MFSIDKSKNKKNFRISVLFLLILFLSMSIYAQKNVVISPVSGDWNNYQSLVLNLSEGETAFYSFTGDDPLNSGFAYDNPVLIEMDGNVVIKVAVVTKENKTTKYSVSYTVQKHDVAAPFYEQVQKSGCFKLTNKTPYTIPENYLFSIGDNTKPYLKGCSLMIGENNQLEQFLPVIISDGEFTYRVVLNVLASINQENISEQTFEENQNEIATEDNINEESLTEENTTITLSNCPFTVSFEQWNTIKISTAENMYVCLDGGKWQTGTFELLTDRTKEHILYWMDIAGMNIENFDPEKLAVKKCFIPIKPTIIKDTDEITKLPVTLTLSDKNYLMNFNNSSDTFSSLIIDTPYGNNFSENVEVVLYYDGIKQGSIITKVEIDKQPPVLPTFETQNTGFFTRDSVNLKINSEDEIFYGISDYLIADFALKNLELVDEKDAIEKITDYQKVDNEENVIFLSDNRKGAMYYVVSVYAKDKAGNISDKNIYQVVIDKYNYYIDAQEVTESYKPDGSPSRPFTSFDQLTTLLSDGIYKKIFLEGDFLNVPMLKITSDCDFIAKDNSKISFIEDNGFDIEKCNVTISNCIIEQNMDLTAKTKQQFLFKLNSANLKLDNCEVVSMIEKNGSLIFANKAKLDFVKTGLTVQSSDFASGITALNSTINCNQVRLSVVAKSGVGISLNKGNLSLSNSEVLVDSSLCSIIDILKCNYSLENNKFVYKTYSQNLINKDIFCKETIDNNNSLTQF